MSIPLPTNLTYSKTINDHVFLYDNTTLYFFETDEDTGTSMWAYNVSQSSFMDLSVGGGPNNPVIAADGAWASNPATGQSWYVGASSSGLAKRSASLSTPSPQILDSSTPSNISWLPGASDGPQLSAATMVFVRAGKAGILVAFGGVNVSASSLLPSGTNHQ